MTDHSVELLGHVREIRKLLELLAEPAIAKRDAKLREELKGIVGRSKPKQKSVLLMNGSHRQRDIQTTAKINQGHLSSLVGQLKASNLLTGDPKFPALAISVPENFFEREDE